jgi:hypothetical protein
MARSCTEETPVAIEFQALVMLIANVVAVHQNGPNRTDKISGFHSIIFQFDSQELSIPHFFRGGHRLPFALTC